MSRPVGVAVQTLRLILDQLTSGSCCVSPSPCRTAVYLGGEVPWDSCDAGGCGNGRNGMLYAKLVSIDPVSGSQGAGRCQEYRWTAEVGILRCISGLDESGNPPKPAAIEKDARQQAKDADSIFDALMCCPTRPESLQEVTLTRWSPLGPQGKCAGGAWLMTGDLSVCC